MNPYYYNNPFLPQYYNVPPQHPPQGAPGLHPLQTHGAEGLHFAYAEYDQNSRVMTPTLTSSARNRNRRTGADGEHVKHRRTRSGCYTCRNRRVKCDEHHPICERCRKGNRECKYPEQVSSAKSDRSGGKSKLGSPHGSDESGDEDAQQDKDDLEPIADEDEEVYDEDSPASAPPELPGKRESPREASDPPSLTHDDGPSPATEGSLPPASSIGTGNSPRAPRKQSTKKPVAGVKWAELPQDIQFYLNHFNNNVTLHHYTMKCDGADWVHTDFLKIARNHEPLLYAVVGFSAYIHTLSRPDGKVNHFLNYYNKSVSSLRASLQSNQEPTEATLLTVLQLACIEEYLGDWVTLLGHQKAAYHILNSLYTPETINETETRRKLLSWYIRFDLFAGFLSGYETVLDRSWFVSSHDHYAEELRKAPDNKSLIWEKNFAYSRLLATDMAVLFARMAKRQLSEEESAKEVALLAKRVSGYAHDIDPSLTEKGTIITDFTGAPPRDPDDIVDPYDPSCLFGGDLWTMNIVLIDFLAIDLTFKYQLAMIQRKQPTSEIAMLAYKVCQRTEALELHPKSPKGILIECQASLGMATLFLPKDQKHIMWCRKKFAKVEMLGYIYPVTFRNRMGEAWGEDVSKWWLPNEEYYPPIVRQIKGFIDERTTQPRDQTSTDLRDMKGMFASLAIDDTPSPDSTASSERTKSTADLDARTLSGKEDTRVYEGSPEYWQST